MRISERPLRCVRQALLLGGSHSQLTGFARLRLSRVLNDETSPTGSKVMCNARLRGSSLGQISTPLRPTFTAPTPPGGCKPVPSTAP
jgi:hypothetical protein